MLAAAAIFATLCGLCVYAIVVNRRCLAEDERVHRLLESTPEKKIAEADGDVILSGRASAKDGATVNAPFSGGEALWACSRAQTNVGQIVRERIESVDAIVLDDGTGQAILSMKDANVRLESKSVPNAPQGSAGHGEFTYEAVLRPGDFVSVLGKAVRTGGYRENTLEMTGITIFDGDREGKQPERRKRAIGCATFGAIAFGLAAVGAFLAR